MWKSNSSLPRARIDLLELKLMQRYNFAILVEDEESSAGGALINGTNKGCGSVGRHG